MANLDEDVIELGSSDEEREPAPKKKKPMPNAMVHIPSKLPGVTIKPATASKSKLNPVSIAKGNIGKAVTVTKVSSSGANIKLSNPFANKNILNGRVTVRKQIVQATRPGMPTINPAVTVRPMPAGKVPLKIAKGIHTAPTIIRTLPQGTLPPGITVKRTNQLQPVLKRNMKPNPVNIQAKRKVSNTPHKKTGGTMVFVDLDDDDSAPSPAGPQWYLRPEDQDKKPNKSTESEEKLNDDEEQTNKTNTGTNEVEKETSDTETGAADLEERNNKEHDPPKYIEITIEDSPAKPQPKRACEVSELAITIDDSPVKGPSNKSDPPSDSDEETTASHEKHSKKKLEYPKILDDHETVEIEIELTPVENHSRQNDDKTDSQYVQAEIVEILESPLKPAESFHTSTPKKKLNEKLQLRTYDNKSASVSKPKLKLDGSRTMNVPNPHSKVNDIKTPTTPGEFHPIYQSFIDLCFRLENSEDMSKIVEKKIKAYYRQVPKEYTESEMFTDMVSSKINAMRAGPEKMYLYIKDVVDELNLQRKIAKTQPVKVVTVNQEQDKFLYGEDSEFDSKRQRQIRKLEKTLKKLHRAIQKLEEQEVDFDDEEDSVYLLTESEDDTSRDNQPLEKSELLKRYKERMIRVHAKFCQLTNTKMPSEPRVQIDARPGQPKGAAKRLEKWINKKVPIGTPLPFPDFHDVLRCTREANQEDKLGWNESYIMEEARDLFVRCGKKLQRRRQENEWRLAASRIQSELDPAEESEVLKKALEDNRRVASKKESEVLNKFADKQNQLNLEAVEIGDKEAEESPVETDDEEPTEESSPLQTKEKRKERIMRLLQKKNKKVAEEKDQPGSITKDKSQVEKSKETENKEETTKDSKSQMETENEERVTLSDKQNDVEKDPLSINQDDKENDNKADSENVHTLSEDSSKIDSDIDELHLLQKLHSNVIDSSTLESSDSESAIAISDTLSSGDNRKQASDVISIENSSYSESEKNNEQENEIVSYSQKKIVTESVNAQIEIECSDAGVEKIINKSNNDEYNESVEDILLASSDDEASKEVKSKGDPISIDKTNVDQSKDENTNGKNTGNSEENVDNTDATSMDSTEMTVAKYVIESSEVTSITSTETCDDDINNAVEVASINLVEAVEGDTLTYTADTAQKDVPVTCVKPAETVKDAGNKSTTDEEDVTMTSMTENNKTSNEVNDVKSGIEDEKPSKDDKSLEVTSSKPTVFVEDNITDKTGADTSVVLNNGVNKGSDITEDIADVNDKESDEKTFDDQPDPEPMEVDDDKT